MQSSKVTSFQILVQALLTFYVSLSVAVSVADDLGNASENKKGYAKGDSVPVSCLNRTM